MRKWLLIALLIAGLVPGAAAQMRGGFGFGGVRNGNGFAGHYGQRFGRGLGWYGDPFFYSDYPSQSVVYEPPASPVVVVQSAAAAASEPKAEPLMIEWQGDHYVRFSGQRGSTEATNVTLDYSEVAPNAPAAVNERSEGRPSRLDLPPAVLIYRDGHREAVSDYVIASGTLYARGDYYRDGFWTKTVQLSALDIPATVRANADSGVNFVLPSGPNEVVTRP
jgi:hypothetical protein